MTGLTPKQREAIDGLIMEAIAVVIGADGPAEAWRNHAARWNWPGEEAEPDRSPTDHLEFTPLKGADCRFGSAKSCGGIAPIGVEPQRADSVRVEASVNRREERGCMLSVTLEGDRAVVEQRAVDAERAASIDELAAPHDCIAKVVTVVEPNGFVLEILTSRTHGSLAPVVVRIDTVAGRGDAASVSPKAPTQQEHAR